MLTLNRELVALLLFLASMFLIGYGTGALNLWPVGIAALLTGVGLWMLRDRK